MSRKIENCKGCEHFWVPTMRTKVLNLMTIGLYPKEYGCGVGMCCPGCGPTTYRKRKFEKLMCPKEGEKKNA